MSAEAMMKTLARLGIFASVAFTLLRPPASLAGADQKTALQLFVDTAQFRADSTQSRLEIYQGVSRPGLDYQNTPAGFIANFKLTTRVFHSDSLVWQDELTQSDTLGQLGAIKAGQQFVYLLPLLLKPGKYKIETLLLDRNRHRQVRDARTETIRPFPAKMLSLSSIQLASRISRAQGRPGPFDKNRLRILPNPRATYGDGMEKISLYAEVYNLYRGKGKAGNYRIDYSIEDLQGKVLLRLPGKDRPKNHPHAGITSTIDISSLPSGRYRIRVSAIDEETLAEISTTKNFTIFRRIDATLLAAKQEKQVYQDLDEKALQHYFDQIAYIANAEEKKVFAQLNTEGKRNFLIQFWKRRDPTPGTPENEFKEDYIQRLLKAKIHFTVGKVEGWQTDRGRILLTYGTPDFIDREPANPDKSAY
ncbi:MAG: GWxTD domain-containing protein [Calditrichaeota bacterium]|nr:MAG: GWxTD domain-containing protein [Calditrichota bacterium]